MVISCSCAMAISSFRVEMFASRMTLFHHHRPQPGEVYLRQA
jgi:hypothetical protein